MLMLHCGGTHATRNEIELVPVPRVFFGLASA